MILNSKQLEELENIQDASGEFEEEAGDPDGYVEGVENALAWRRGMIERAVNNIRKLVRKPIDSMDGLAIGALVYLKESKRFVRIHENQDGHTELSFVGPTPTVGAASGKAEKPAKAAKGPKAEKPPKAEKAPKPAKASKPVKAEKPPKAEKPSKAIPVKAEKPAKVAPVAAKPTKPTGPVKAAAADKASAKAKMPTPVKAEAKQKVDTKTKGKAVVSKKSAGAKSAAEKVTKKVPLKQKKAAKPVSKPKLKKAPPKKVVQKAKPKAAAAKKNTAKKMPRKSASNYMMDPVADPNGYIRSNFRLMSNKELSHVTGLSEHTIRRKLGEWGLKRI